MQFLKRLNQLNFPDLSGNCPHLRLVYFGGSGIKDFPGSSSRNVILVITTTIYYYHNIIGDELLLNFGAKFQHYL